MAWYKGTEQQVKTYNDEVSASRNYTGEIQKWSPVMEIESNYYVAKHPDFDSEMEEVDSLPIIEDEFI